MNSNFPGAGVAEADSLEGGTLAPGVEPSGAAATTVGTCWMEAAATETSGIETVGVEGVGTGTALTLEAGRGIFDAGVVVAAIGEAETRDNGAAGVLAISGRAFG